MNKTPKKHHDYAALARASDMMEKAYNFIENSMASSKARADILRIQQKLIGYLVIFLLIFVTPSFSTSNNSIEFHFDFIVCVCDGICVSFHDASEIVILIVFVVSMNCTG